MRLATHSDANNLSALATQVFLHTYATDGVTRDLSDFVLDAFSPDAFGRSIDDPSLAILLEEADGALIGFSEIAFGAVCPADQSVTTEVTRLYVQEYFTGAGVGTRLLNECSGFARDHIGDPALWLTAYAGNRHAIEFYAHRGFERVGEQWFELDSVAHLNYVLMRSE